MTASGGIRGKDAKHSITVTPIQWPTEVSICYLPLKNITRNIYIINCGWSY